MKDQNAVIRKLEEDLQESQRRIEELEGLCRDLTERANKLQLKIDIQSLVLENNLMGIAFVRRGVFVWVNRRLAEMLGRSETELVGMAERIIYPSDEAYTEAVRA
ncbi:MAG: PAS domain-containing protein, partial [Syntrophales bacterium]|nr:PAS domain-containing protein [Syntrophales bacterium]